jgi:glycosyltransferase involved in cell wall biosynthesis
MRMDYGLNLVVRDEIDLIDDFLRYHYSQGIDMVFATDNGSRDGTLEVLKKYEAEGRLHLIEEPPFDFSMHRWFTRQAALAAESGVKWLLCCDADEFIIPPRGARIIDVLREIPESCDCIAIPRFDFVNTERDYRRSPAIEMIHRLKESRNSFGNIIPPKVTFRPAPGLVVTQGAHSLEGKAAASQDRLRIFHYPARSYGQFVRKVENAGSQYDQNRELPKSVGGQKRLWFEMLRKGELEEEYRRRFYRTPAQIEAGLLSGELIATHDLADALLHAGDSGAVAT